MGYTGVLSNRQVVELLGRNLLATALIRDGLEVARPERDRGIDLIAYLDTPPFRAIPIQMKASTDAAFAVDRKYERIHTLLLAYVWHVDDAGPGEMYALTYPEAEAVATTMGWTKTASWAAGIYTTTRPSGALLALLAPHRMVAGAWRRRFEELAAR